MPISDYLKRIRAAIGHEMLLNPGVAAIIRDEAGRVLLQKRSDDGTWSLPAGAIDPGETPAQAVVREAQCLRKWRVSLAGQDFGIPTRMEIRLKSSLSSFCAA